MVYINVQKAGSDGAMAWPFASVHVTAIIQGMNQQKYPLFMSFGAFNWKSKQSNTINHCQSGCRYTL